jgi:hypothetical protein
MLKKPTIFLSFPFIYFFIWNIGAQSQKPIKNIIIEKNIYNFIKIYHHGEKERRILVGVKKVHKIHVVMDIVNITIK